MHTFFRKLSLLLRGKLPDYGEFAALSLKSDRDAKTYRETIYELKKKLEIVERKNASIPIIGYNDYPVEPQDEKERDIYIANVDEFYENILKKKIMMDISEVRDLISSPSMIQGMPVNMTRSEYDSYLRGMQSYAWKIDEWARTLQAEAQQKRADLENNNK